MGSRMLLQLRYHQAQVDPSTDRPPSVPRTSFADRGDPVPLNKYVFLTLSGLEPHPEVTNTVITGPPLFPHSTVVSQLLQIYGDIFAVLTLPSDIITGQIYNQEINIWNWRTGDHLCVGCEPASQNRKCSSYHFLRITNCQLRSVKLALRC